MVQAREGRVRVPAGGAAGSSFSGEGGLQGSAVDCGGGGGGDPWDMVVREREIKRVLG